MTFWAFSILLKQYRTSLAKLLEVKRGVPRWQRRAKKPLTVEQILAWADDYVARWKKWPGRRQPGPAPQETWAGIDQALRNGSRGLPGGSTLRRLLAEHGRHRVAPLNLDMILRWVAAHEQRTGGWPTSGPIAEAPGHTWQQIDSALRAGYRGLPGGSSLFKLRRKRHRTNRSRR